MNGTRVPGAHREARGGTALRAADGDRAAPQALVDTGRERGGRGERGGAAGAAEDWRREEPPPFVTALPSNTTHFLNCTDWFARWAANRQHPGMVEFVHVPKAGGTAVETWLWQAYNGALTSDVMHSDADVFRLFKLPYRCAAANPWLTDCRHYHGGHTPFRGRPKGRRFISAVREPISRLISEYNGIVNALSDRSLCRRLPHHSICGSRGQHFCKPKSGCNPWAMRAHNHSGSACDPAVGLLTFLRTMRDAKGSSYINLNYRMLCDSTCKDDQRIYRALHANYFVLQAIDKRQSLPDLFERLAYALGLTVNVSVDNTVSNAAATNSTWQLQFKDVPKEDLLQIRKLNALDERVFHMAQQISQEQQYCFRRMPVARRTHVPTAM